MSGLKGWARSLKRDVLAVWIAARDPRTPGFAKFLAGLVAAYAFSPIDLIPDFIPVLGYLDDLLIVPAGIWLVVRIIPSDLMAEFRSEAASRSQRPTSRMATAIIILVWIAAVVGAAWMYWRRE